MTNVKMSIDKNSNQIQNPDSVKIQDFNDYLNPKESTSVVADKKAAKFSALKEKPLPLKEKPKIMRENRFDSGVADLDQDNSPVSMQAPSGQFRPVSTRAYDYADFGGHQYEELPTSRLPPVHNQQSPESLDSKSEYQSSSGTTVTTEPSETDDTAAIVRNSEQRKRYNPLYDAMINSSPSIYNKVKSVKHKDSAVLKELKFLKCVVIVLLLISLAALALSVYLIIIIGMSDVTNLKKELSSLQDRYIALDSKLSSLEKLTTGNRTFEYFSDLSNQVKQLESQASSNLSKFEKDFQNSSYIIQHNNDEKLNLVFSNLTAVIERMNQDVQANLSQISKMPGPQGPPGVGDLTLCIMKNLTDTARATLASHSTRLLPTNADLQNYVVMFATCSVEGGTGHYIQPVGTTVSNLKYKCVCSGGSSGNRNCTLYVLMCPRANFGAA